VLLGAMVFARATGFSFVSIDDPQAVTENFFVRSGVTNAGLLWALTQTQTFFWQPATWISHMLDCQLFGLNAGWHHAVNLLIHIVNSLLLFLLLRRVTGSAWRSSLVAALFAVHPLATESVVWVAGRRDVLSALFSILALRAYVAYAERPSSGRKYLLVIGLSALAFTARPHTGCLPIFMLLLDYWPLGRWKFSTSWRAGWRTNSHLVREKGPILAMAAVLAGVTLLVLHRTMAAIGLPGYPLSMRLPVSLWAYAAYIRKLTWPFSLSALGAYAAPVGWQMQAATAIFAAITFVAIATRKRVPYLLFGWAWYVAGLLPSLAFAQMENQFMADHLTYFPLIGLFVMAVWGAADWLSAAPRARVMAPWVTVALLLALALRTWAQTGTWRDSAIVYDHAISTAASNEAALRSLCESAFRDRDLGEGLVARYSERAADDPLSPRKHYVLGALLQAQGKRQEALAEFAEAVRHNPDSLQFRKGLGFAFLEVGNREAAYNQLDEALRLSPFDRDRDKILKALPELRTPQRDQALAPPPAVLTTENGMEVLALLFCALVGLITPGYSGYYFQRIEGALRRAASRPVMAMLMVGLAPMVIRLLLLAVYPIPEPVIPDEFSHLLIADTLASGRIANPTHPMWEHFESIYILQHPTYASIYPPAQGTLLAAAAVIGANPWFAVWASVGVMCALLCWMLRGWLPPPWALLGAMLAVFRFSILGHWMNSFWGGSVPAIGGALVLGALPRILKHQRARDSLWLGLGLAILSHSRPYEGFLLMLPAGVMLVVWFTRSEKALGRVRIRRVLIPLAAVLLVDLGTIAYYDWRVTGDPLLMPYLLYQKSYGMPQPFLWQHPIPAPPRVSGYRDIADAYQWQLNSYMTNATRSGLPGAIWEKMVGFWSFYLQPSLTIPLIFLPLIWRNRRLRFLILAAAVVAIGAAFYPFLFPHYLAPICGALLAVVVQGMRYLRAWRWHGRRAGLLLFRSALAVVVAFSFLSKETDFFNPASIRQQTPRGRILEQLSRAGGKHIVLVRYGPQHVFHSSWIYNSADIDASKVVWARELEPWRNRRLLRYFRDRQAWLVDADADPVRLLPYSRDR